MKTKILISLLAIGSLFSGCDVFEVIESVSPEDNAVNINIHTNVKAVFKVSVDSATVNADTFVLKNAGVQVPASVEFNADSKTATLSTILPLDNSTTYTATLTQAIKDTSGRSWGSDYSWSFTTEAYDPAKYIGFYDLSGGPQAIAAYGDYVYVGNKANGLNIMDVSNPRAPLRVFVDYNRGVTGLYIKDDKLYVLNSGLTIYSLENPAAPAQIGFINPAKELGLTGFQFNTWAMNISGDYAFLAQDNYGMIIVNISDASNPTMVSNLNFADQMSENYIPTHIKAIGNTVYMGAHDGGFQVLDVTDINNPILVSNVPDSHAKRFVIHGNYAILVNRSIVDVLDISNPANPTLVKRLQPHSPSSVFSDIKLVGDKAYISDMLGPNILVMDITDVNNPVVTSSLIANQPVVITVKDNHIFSSGLFFGFYVNAIEQ